MVCCPFFSPFFKEKNKASYKKIHRTGEVAGRKEKTSFSFFSRVMNERKEFFFILSPFALF